MRIEAYESGRCSAANLLIDGFWKADDSPSTDFIHVLQDPESKAAKTLRSLILFEPQDVDFSSKVANVYTSMLAVNRRLEYLESTTLDESFDPDEVGLVDTRGRWLPGQPLCSTNRYAFLSVVQHLSPSSTAEPPRKRSRRAERTDGSDLAGWIDRSSR